jgi:hypothetical protein
MVFLIFFEFKPFYFEGDRWLAITILFCHNLRLQCARENNDFKKSDKRKKYMQQAMIVDNEEKQS